MLRLTAAIWLLMAVVCVQAGDRAPDPGTRARKIYVAKCAKCHKFYEPRKYSEAEWERWMDSMSRKSKLKPMDDELLRQYLAEYRAGRITIPQ